MREMDDEEKKKWMRRNCVLHVAAAVQDAAERVREGAAGHLFALGETRDRFTYFLLLLHLFPFLSFSLPYLSLPTAMRKLNLNELVVGSVVAI